MRIHRSFSSLGALLLLLLLVILVFPVAALAADTPQPALALSGNQVGALIAGWLTPILVYKLNHHAPWQTEKVKLGVHIVVAALVGAVYQALFVSHVAVNWTTAEFMVTSVVGALVIGHPMFARAAVNADLGGGTNAPPAAPAQS